MSVFLKTYTLTYTIRDLAVSIYKVSHKILISIYFPFCTDLGHQPPTANDQKDALHNAIRLKNAIKRVKLIDNTPTN